MQNRTAGVIATVVAVLLCGCPGLLLVFSGAIMAAVSVVPGAEIDVFGSNEPSAALTAGIGGLCLGLIFIIIAAVVAFFSLRKKPGAAPEIEPEPPIIPPVTEIAPGPEVSPTAETKPISEEPLPPPS